MACGMYNVPQDIDRWVPLMKQINHSPKVEPQIEGQIRIELKPEPSRKRLKDQVCSNDYELR